MFFRSALKERTWIITRTRSPLVGSLAGRFQGIPPVTSMISTCQGKIHLPLHSTEEIPEAPSLGRIARRFACFDPLRFESTRQRDQTSICGNGSGPSTKIEFV